MPEGRVLSHEEWLAARSTVLADEAGSSSNWANFDQLGILVELVRTFTEQFKNRSNFNVVDKVCSETFVNHLPIPGIPPGRDGMKGGRTLRDRRRP